MQFDFTSQAKSKSSDELKAILRDGDKYQPEMVAAAAAELKARNIDISGIQALRNATFELEDQKLVAGRKGSALYMGICMVAVLAGGIVGVIGGYIYAFSKVTSRSGKSFYTYDRQTRKIGEIIFWVGIVILMLAALKVALSSTGV